MKKILLIFPLLLLLILLSSKQVLCQDNVFTTKTDSLSKVFGQVTLGLSEMASVVVGCHIDKYNAIGLKYSGCWVDNDFSIFFVPSSGNAVGIKYSHLFNYDFLLKQFNFTISAIYSTSKNKGSFSVATFVKGYSVECTVGNEIKLDKGFSFIYEAGFLASQLKSMDLVFFPSLKIGANFNF